jgi:hypothetical protein
VAVKVRKWLRKRNEEDLKWKEQSSQRRRKAEPCWRRMWKEEGGGGGGELGILEEWGQKIKKYKKPGLQLVEIGRRTWKIKIKSLVEKK